MHPLSHEPKSSQANRNWAAVRRPETAFDRELLPDTLAWLRSLPESVRPADLAATYPRIANHLARCRHDPAQLQRYMDSLLVDDRGNRQGFAMPVLRDLMRLHGHFQAIRQYQPRRPRAEFEMPSPREGRYAELDFVAERTAPQLPARRRKPAARPQPAGFFARLLSSLRP